MFPCGYLAVANAYDSVAATQHIKLLKFFVGKAGNIRRRIGGSHELLSELSEAYLKGVTSFLWRKKKHRKLKISTFIWRSMVWSFSEVHRRQLAIKTPTRGIRRLHRKTRISLEEADHVINFRGRESRCSDQALLVYDEKSIDQQELVE